MDHLNSHSEKLQATFEKKKKKIFLSLWHFPSRSFHSSHTLCSGILSYMRPNLRQVFCSQANSTFQECLEILLRNKHIWHTLFKMSWPHVRQAQAYIVQHGQHSQYLVAIK